MQAADVASAEVASVALCVTAGGEAALCTVFPVVPTIITVQSTNTSSGITPSVPSSFTQSLSNPPATATNTPPSQTPQTPTTEPASDFIGNTPLNEADNATPTATQPEVSPITAALSNGTTAATSTSPSTSAPAAPPPQQQQLDPVAQPDRRRRHRRVGHHQHRTVSGPRDFRVMTGFAPRMSSPTAQGCRRRSPRPGNCAPSLLLLIEVG